MAMSCSAVPCDVTNMQVKLVIHSKAQHTVWKGQQFMVGLTAFDSFEAVTNPQRDRHSVIEAFSVTKLHSCSLDL